MNLLHPGAGLHGHEYSSPAPPKSRSPSPRIALHRSPFSAPTRPSSYQDTTSTARSSIRFSGQLSPTKLRDPPDRVAFLDPDTDAMSDDGRSAGYSDGSVAARGRQKKKRFSRHTSTSYYLAHPAPTLTQKQRLVHIRPKLLIQLQKLSAEARPKPTIDVMSSSSYVPRLSKKFPGLYRGSGLLGVNDVMIVRSEDYDTLDEEKEVESVVEDAASDRDILAVICQVPKGEPGNVEICLEDGSRWNAAPSAKGILELIKTDAVTGEKTIARWVPKGMSRRNSLQTPVRRASEIMEPRYQFSFIDPNTRRHPILATLSQGTLKISNTYSPVSKSEDEHQISSSRTSLDEDHVDSDANVDLKKLVVYEDQRLLIEVSAVWIALKQGWCPSFHYGEGCSPTNCVKFPATPSSSKLDRPRSFTMTPSSTGKHKRTRSSTVTSIPESVNSSNGTVRSRRSVFARATFSASTFESPEERPPPKRTVSNGAVFMQKAAARKAGHESRNCSSGSENDESRASSPRRLRRLSQSDSVDITEGVRLSSMLVPSPGFQIKASPETPKSPTKARSPLSATTNLMSRSKSNRKSNSYVPQASENQKPVGGIVVDATLPFKSPRTPEPPTPKVKKEKENRRFSSLIRFFKGKSGKRS